MSPRPPPKKHQTKASQPVWRPGDSRQVISQANAENEGPTQELTVKVLATSSAVVPHSLGRLPKAAWITDGSPKVTVTGATTTTVTVTNTDSGPHTVQVALF